MIQHSMSATTWNVVAHGWTRWINPVPPADIDRVLLRLELPRGAYALDLGCGKGELLIRLNEAEDADVSGVGVDHCRPFVEDARAEAGRRVPGAGIVFEYGDAAETARRARAADLAACIGAHPFGESWAETLEGLADVVRPGGWILGGEGFVVGGDEPLLEHGGLLEIGKRLGLDPVDAVAATPKTCLEYEKRCRDEALAWVSKNPEHPDAKSVSESCHIWYDTWQQRGPLQAPGFGLYLFRRW